LIDSFGEPLEIAETVKVGSAVELSIAEKDVP
jgi:positive regulator of sigma E activity